MTGTASRTARVSTARWNLKEAAGKLPARRTEIAYEAVPSGREGQEKVTVYLSELKYTVTFPLSVTFVL